MIHNFFSNVSIEKVIVKNSIYVLTSTALGGLLSAATTVLLSRIFTPQDFGTFKTLTAFYGFFIYFLDFGFQNTIIKYTSEFLSARKEEKIRHLIHNLLFFRLLILIPIVVLSLIFRNDITEILLKNRNLGYLIYPAILFSIITFSDLTRPIIIGLQNFRLLSAVNIIVPFFGLILLAPSALLLGLPFTIVTLGLTHLAGSLFSVYFLIGKKLHFKTKESPFKWPSLVFSYGLPAYFSTLPSYAFLAIIPFLSLFFEQKIIGYYAFSLSFYTVAMIVPVGISQIIFPKIASLSIKNLAKAKQVLRNTLFFYSAIVIVEIISVVLLARVVISVLSPNFLPATNLVVAMVITASILGFGTLLISYFTARSKLKLAFIFNLVQASIFVFVSYTATLQLL